MGHKKADRPRFDTNRMRTVAVVWFEGEAAWRRMREVSVDPERLGASFEQWQERHAASVKKLEQGNAMAIPIQVDADEFAEWCERHGRTADATARSLFAAERMRG